MAESGRAAPVLNAIMSIRMRRKEPCDDGLTKWVVKKGNSPWELGTFKGPNPLTLLRNFYQDIRTQEKLSKSKKDLLASWGLFIALQDAEEFINELLQKVEESTVQLNGCAREIERLSDARQDLLAAKRSLTDSLHKREQELEHALAEVAAAKSKISSLEVQFTEAQGAANFLVQERKAKLRAVSHTACQREIETLKQKLGLQQALIASVRPENLDVLPSLLSEETLPVDALSQSPLDPDWQKEPPQGVPVCPVVNKTIRTQNAQGRVTQQDIAESMPWKALEAKAVAESLGPFNKDTGIAWMTAMVNAHPTADGRDLTQIAKICANSADAAAIEASSDQRNLTGLNQLDWMRAMIPVMWPGKDAVVLYVVETQAPGESPEAYVSRKKLLARIANAVPIVNGAPDFNDVQFKARLRSGLNAQTRLMLGPMNPATTTWLQMKARIEEVSDTLREAGALQSPSEGAQRVLEPIQAVRHANNGLHSQPRGKGGNGKGRGHWKRKKLQSASNGNWGQTGNQVQLPQTGQSPQENQPLPTPGVSSQSFRNWSPRAQLRYHVWAMLRSLGENMERYDKQPLTVLLSALLRLEEAREWQENRQPVATILEAPNDQDLVNLC